MSVFATPSLLPLGAVTRSDVRFNVTRAAPYAVMLVFIGNALLWWGAGPAPSRGWATNSDVFIVGMFTVFSFMTLPFFVALIMGDPVIRDFELGIDPLVFSKPVKRFEYLLGKFLGNFAVLVACEACFALTLLLLQATPLEGMLTVAPRVTPFVKHFLVLIVLSSLPLAMLSFVVGTLTRSVKLVYAATTLVYVLYGAWQVVVLRSLSPTWRVALDPLLMNWSDAHKVAPAAIINDLEFGYGLDVAVNRALAVLVSTLLFALLYARFSPLPAAPPVGSVLSFGGVKHRGPRGRARRSRPPGPSSTASTDVPARPVVAPATGARARRHTERQRVRGQWATSLGAQFNIELRAIAAERSVVVLLPLAVVFCLVDAAYLDAPGTLPSASYATSVAVPLLIACTAITIIYLGESMARERTLRIEPLVWAAPVSNAALLLAKLAATLVLALVVTSLVMAGGAGIQVAHGHGPITLGPFALVSAVIVLPTLLFAIAATLAVNVAVHDKHAAYAACLAIVGLMYWLLTHGYDGPWYNIPLLGRWTLDQLSQAGSPRTFVLLHRGYVLVLTMVLSSASLAAFARRRDGRASGVWRRTMASRR